MISCCTVVKAPRCGVALVKHKHPPHPPFSRPPSISHMFQIPLLALPSLRAQAPAPTYVSPASLRWHLKTGPAGQVHRNKAVHTLFRTGTHACICTHTQTHMRVGIQMQTCRGNSKSELPTRSGRGPRCLPRSPADDRSGSSWACPNICVCVHICVCVVWVRMCVYVCVHVPMCVDTYVNERMPEFWHACAHMCNCVHVWMYVLCMCAKLLVCVHVRVRG